MSDKIDISSIRGIEHPTAEVIHTLVNDAGYDQNSTGAIVYAGKCILAGLLGVTAGLHKLAIAYEHATENKVR